MGKVWQQYTKEMAKRFGYLAAWTPGVQMSLGDVGVLKDNLFTRVTSLKNLGISFSPTAPDNSEEDVKYASSGNVSIAFKAAGKVPSPGSALSEAEAGVTVEFNRKSAVVYEALGCTSPAIDDQVTLGDEIVSRYARGSWNKDWVVITQVVHAKSGSVLISAQSGAKIEVSASGKVTAGSFSMADASLGLSIVVQHDMQTTILAKTGMTPLFKARGIKSQLPVALAAASGRLNATDLIAPDDAKAQRTYYFGNYGYAYANDDDPD
jgi:hypothetical protein